MFVTGNHDSDYLSRELARDGAVVLTRNGRLEPDGTFGPLIYRLNELRVAGYDDPFERRSSEAFRDRYDDTPDTAQQDLFLDWLRPLIGKVDVVMVHEPALIAHGADRCCSDQPAGAAARVPGRPHAQGGARRRSRA